MHVKAFFTDDLVITALNTCIVQKLICVKPNGVPESIVSGGHFGKTSLGSEPSCILKAKIPRFLREI